MQHPSLAPCPSQGGPHASHHLTSLRPSPGRALKSTCKGRGGVIALEMMEEMFQSRPVPGGDGQGGGPTSAGPQSDPHHTCPWETDQPTAIFTQLNHVNRITPNNPVPSPAPPSPAPPEAPRLGWCCERGRSGRGRAGAPHGAAPTAAPSRLSQLGCWLLPLTPRVRRRGAATALRRAKQESWLTLIPCLLLGAVRILRSNDISRFMLGTFIAAAAGSPGLGV